MLRPRVGFAVDPTDLIVTVRYIGAIGGDHIVPAVLKGFAAVERAWDYDCIFDLSRHDGLVEIRDNDALARGWLNLTGGRDAGRRTAVVSSDPLIDARLPLIQPMFPFRTLMTFASVEAARGWLLASRTEEARGVSAA